MKKPLVGAAVLAVGGWAIASGALVVPTAFASPNNGTTFNGTTHCDPTAPPDPNNPACGQNPAITGPKPDAPLNCPAFLRTDGWALNFLGGHSVSHGTLNANGEWGGGTVTGPAALTTSDGTIQYSGHLTEWFGGGQNFPPGTTPTQQSEGGFTTNFNGSGLAGTISIHVNGHITTNNAGNTTATVMNLSVTCS